LPCASSRAPAALAREGGDHRQPSFVGEASVEAKATEGEPGELVAAAVDRRVGKSVTGAPTASWADLREAYRYWTKQFRYQLCMEPDATDCTAPEA
jgi:hypothetical protein